MKAKRLISWYDKYTEECVGEKDISNVDFDKLKEIFQPSSDDPYLVRPKAIDKSKAKALKRIINIEFFLKTYDYFLECFKAEN